MPRKGMRSAFFHPNSSQSSSPSIPSSASYIRSMPSSPLNHSFSESPMDRNVANAECMITMWYPESSSFNKVTSLFRENRREVEEFLQAARELQRSMHLYIRQCSSSEKLIHAQILVQTAMKRLEE